MKNYAYKDAGATILWSSKGIKNSKALLSSNKEEYLIIPNCTSTNDYEIIINLSEDIVIEEILLNNKEEFSANLKEIDVLGSIEYPTEKWIKLGSMIP